MNIYTYSMPEVYLKDMLAAKKQKNPQFSLRAWARLLGMKTHTPLQLMLASKRPIPKKYIPLFGKSLSLTEEEVLYLEVMIDHQRARKEEDKAFHKSRMVALQAANTSQSEQMSEQTDERVCEEVEDKRSAASTFMRSGSGTSQSTQIFS